MAIVFFITGVLIAAQLCAVGAAPPTVCYKAQLPNEDDPYSFYQCDAGGRPHLRRCAAGTMYDKDTEICDWESNVLAKTGMNGGGHRLSSSAYPTRMTGANYVNYQVPSGYDTPAGSAYYYPPSGYVNPYASTGFVTPSYRYDSYGWTQQSQAPFVGIDPPSVSTRIDIASVIKNTNWNKVAKVAGDHLHMVRPMAEKFAGKHSKHIMYHVQHHKHHIHKHADKVKPLINKFVDNFHIENDFSFEDISLQSGSIQNNDGSDSGSGSSDGGGSGSTSGSSDEGGSGSGSGNSDGGGSDSGSGSSEGRGSDSISGSSDGGGSDSISGSSDGGGSGSGSNESDVSSGSGESDSGSGGGGGGSVGNGRRRMLKIDHKTSNESESYPSPTIPVNFDSTQEENLKNNESQQSFFGIPSSVNTTVMQRTGRQQAFQPPPRMPPQQQQQQQQPPQQQQRPQRPQRPLSWNDPIPEYFSSNEYEEMYPSHEPSWKDIDDDEAWAAAAARNPQRNREESRPQPSQALLARLECRNTGQGPVRQYPNPEDCSTFFTCNMGRPVLTHCPRELFYNPQRRGCDDTVQSGCVRHNRYQEGGSDVVERRRNVGAADKTPIETNTEATPTQSE